MSRILLYVFLFFPLCACSDLPEGNLYLKNINTNEKITLEMQKADIFEIMGEPKKIEKYPDGEIKATSLVYEDIIFIFRGSPESLDRIIVSEPTFSWNDITIGSHKSEISKIYASEYLLDGSVYDNYEKKQYNSVIIRFADKIGKKVFKADYMFEHKQEIFKIEFIYDSNEKIEKIVLQKTMMWVGLPPVD